MGNRLCICLILFVFGIFSFCRFSNAECDLGVWGESCQYNCSSNCYHGSDCFTNGNACGCEQDHGVCYGCTKKYHGDFCSLECNKNCSLSDECLQNGIGCGCHRQYGSCSSCPKTLWGQYCERGCSESCINSECDTGSGECTLGCIQGYYGDRCDLACPVSCQYGCVRDTAQCLPSYCVNCFGGLSNCDQGIGKCKSGCVEGFYGDSCDKTCAAITSISLCSKCTTLPSIGITVCSECQSGYYSDQFLNECKFCSTGCNSSSTSIAKCFPDSGICRFGCSSGWTGDKCDVFNCAVSHCDTCVVNQPTNCAVCQTEWFLDSGQCFQCSENCATTNVCDKTTGTCTAGCKSGWHGSKCMDSCTTNCLQGQCDTNGVCSNGCNGKRYGQKCDILCPNCLTTCNQNSGLCDSTCVNGFFGNDCSQSCPANCLNNLCNQGNGICLGCKSGYYGNTCQLPCNNNCGSNTCDATTGACSGSCIDGKYGDYCDLECPVNCSPKLCVKEGGACSSLCENGFYGSHCNVPCPTSCSSNKCNKEGGICTDNCPSGKYGDRCELSCSSNCNSTLCDRNTGRCLDGCKAGYYGDTCQNICARCDSMGCLQTTGSCIGKCNNGFYGSKCDEGCSIGCFSSSCDKDTGKCYPCKEGYLGQTCSSTCSDSCKFSKCNQTTGYCTDGCSAGNFGQYCDQKCPDCTVCDQSTGECEGCAVGKYGTNCVNNCSKNCGLSSSGQVLCDGTTGYCLNGCKDSWYGSYCTVPCNNGIHCIGSACERHSGECSGNCVAGWYGNKCSLKCSVNCNKETCDKMTGICIFNCTSGFYGTSCTLPCANNCSECEQISGTCTRCKTGIYGQNCESLCSNHCSLSADPSTDKVCHKQTGICIGGCSIGWYGRTCSSRCPSNCYSIKCNIDSGKCENGCTNDRYGEYCENTCTNCAGNSNGNCNALNGICLYGCNDGYFGNFCSQTCSTRCKNKKCIHSKFNCSYGCENGHYGPSCTESCSENCINSICDQTTGRCTGGCIPGWFGEKCKYACPSSCARGICDRVTGNCGDICSGSDCEGTTKEEEDDETNIAIIIGAIIGGAVVLLIIIIIVCCHCVRTRNSRKGGSEDILTHKSDSLNGVDNPQFDHFDEIKKDDWVMRHHIPYEIVKQNGALNTQREAEAEIDYYDFHTRPLEVHVVHHDRQAVQADVMQPHPLAAQFDDFDGRDGIQVEMLPQYVEYMLHKANGFETEYNDLPQGLKHPHEVALRPGNKAKNRYKNIYTYDHSRVILEPEDTVSDDSSSSTINDNSDYINASYLDGYHDQRAYIACQGPTDEMVNDFWRMVWQLRIQNIVMLTNLVELGHVKCKKYWPDEYKTEKYGNLYVKFDYQEVFADFILTNLIITRDNARLQVKHLQFTSWPDRDVPRYVTPLLEYYSKVKSLHREGPLLVHCSAGVGRSGTFIALDYLMDQADSEDKVNIYKCVDKMRISRPNMVQTSEQYTFLHIALVEALQTSQSPVDEDEFENYYNQMLIKDTRSGVSKLENEFRDVKCQKVQCMYEAASLGENKHRNRRPDILASDECRVFLWSKIKGCTDYINAIYLPSYRNKYCFIATEMPQCSTIIDFCRMIFQEEVRTVVMLDNSSSGINATEHYWPNPNQTVECGPFSIKVTETVEHQDYTLKSLKFSFSVDDQNGTYKVNQFHYKHWSEGKVTPYSVESFLNFVKAVTDWQSDSVRHPIIVHCLDGASKVGLFCLVRACLDRLQSDGEVSVVHALHHMRARRTQIVPNFDQYKFCHECILRQINSL